MWGLLAAFVAVPSQASAKTLSVADAIRLAWQTNPGLAGSRDMVVAAQADAEAARDQRLPTLQVQINAVATKEPVAAFGLRLDELVAEGTHVKRGQLLLTLSDEDVRAQLVSASTALTNAHGL